MSIQLLDDMTGHCFGCLTTIPVEPGVAYCAACVAEQTQAHAAELRAFDEFHAYADRCAR